MSSSNGCLSLNNEDPYIAFKIAGGVSLAIVSTILLVMGESTADGEGFCAANSVCVVAGASGLGFFAGGLIGVLEKLCKEAPEGSSEGSSEGFSDNPAPPNEDPYIAFIIVGGVLLVVVSTILLMEGLSTTDDEGFCINNSACVAAGAFGLGLFVGSLVCALRKDCNEEPAAPRPSLG